MKVGMIGLDTSHVKIFTELLHDSAHPYHVLGGRVTVASPSPSLDMELSHTRVDEYTTLLRDHYDVSIVETAEHVANQSDLILITSVDGSKHLDFFKRIVSYRKPVFIDKPLTLSIQEAKEIFSLAEHYKTPVMSSSSLRYADSLVKTLQEKGAPNGVYLSGPTPIINDMPGYFWYGIHMVEMLVTMLGVNVKEIHVHNNERNEVITAEWEDGHIGIIKGENIWHSRFEAFLHYEDETVHLPIYQDPKPYYASLLEEVIEFGRSGVCPIDQKETLAIICLIEEANEKRS